jgi:hypothetical protein
MGIGKWLFVIGYLLLDEFRPCWSFLQQATVRFIGENSNKGNKGKKITSN